MGRYIDSMQFYFLPFYRFPFVIPSNYGGRKVSGSWYCKVSFLFFFFNVNGRSRFTLIVQEYTTTAGFFLLISRTNFSPDVSLSTCIWNDRQDRFISSFSSPTNANFALRNTPFVSTWSTNFVLSTRFKRSIQFYYPTNARLRSTKHAFRFNFIHESFSPPPSLSIDLLLSTTSKRSI